LQTGAYISGLAHIGLVWWMIFGGTFQSEPLPFEVQEVSVISSADFATLIAPQTSPIVAPDPVDLPDPAVTPDAPDVTAAPYPVPEPQDPTPQAEPADPIPEPPAPVSPPTAEVTTNTPPQPEPQPETRAPPSVPRPAARVAPMPVAPPPPDTDSDEVVREEVTPDEGAEAPQPIREATAPEEAGTEIETEATEAPDEVTLAPMRSLRPPSRPSRPTPPTPEPTATAQSAPTSDPDPTPSDGTEDAVNAALAEALGAPSEPAPVGPPLSQGETDALRVAVSQCWNVGSLSSAALTTSVVVGVEMTPQGRPVTSSIRMASFEGGTAAAAQQAFEVARRAIIRCGAAGFGLPEDKYAAWRNIEMTFDPERMRIR